MNGSNFSSESTSSNGGENRQAESIGSRGVKAPLWLIHSYNRLLADCSLMLGLPPLAPLGIEDMPWVLKEGPALDKELLRAIESFPLDGDKYLRSLRPPTWLLPVWEMACREICEPSGDAVALRELRHLLLFGYKAEVEPTNEQIEAAQAAFEMADLECDSTDMRLLDAYAGPGRDGTEVLRKVLESARQMVGRVICNITWPDINPSHGPGAVFPQSKPGFRGRFRRIYTSIQQCYPFDRYFLSGKNALGDTSVWEMQEEPDIIARLTAVPKDSRGPRIICVHPPEAIWIQQGQRRLLEAAIESHWLTRGRINFRDQSVNGKMALQASLDRSYCTIDLSEASDRVSGGIVHFLFGDYAYSYLRCARANKCQLFDGRVIELHKYAPMGNATTFPIEALVFWSVVRAGIRHCHNIYCDDVYVFGDDIIVPSCYVEGAVLGLRLAGLKVNQSKTFVRGLFRESCGVDAFNGKDVTPLRLKVGGITTVSEAISVCDLAKRARLQGRRELSAYLYSSVSKRFGVLPLSNNPGAQGMVEYVDMTFDRLVLFEPSLRWDGFTHRWLSRTFQKKSLILGSFEHDWCHVLDSLVTLTLRGTLSSGRGTEYPVPHRDRLISGWAEVILS